MVGGTVVGIVRAEGEPTLLHVGGKGCEEGDRCCVRVKEGPDPIRIGDDVWWQSGVVYWTPNPRDGREDVKLPKVGYSFGHPDGDT